MTLRALIVLATICLAGTQVGSALAWLAASRLAVDPSTRPLPSVDPIEQSPLASILAGHLFAPTDEAPPPPPPGAPDDRCEVPWRMVGSWIDRRSPDRSFASVHTPDGGRLIGTGQTHEGLTLVEMDRSAIILTREDGTRCRVSMFDEAIAALGDVSAPTPVGVRRLSSSHVAVDRGLLDDPTGLPRRMRALPHMVDGQMVGVRLYGIRTGDPIHVAGARNGDVLSAVDGEALSDPNVALAAYGRLRAGDPVRVTIERRGETIDTTVQSSN